MVLLEENSFNWELHFNAAADAVIADTDAIAWRWLFLAQVKFCKRNPGFMDSVRLGAVRAIDECQYQVSVYRPDQITDKGVKMDE